MREFVMRGIALRDRCNRGMCNNRTVVVLRHSTVHTRIVEFQILTQNATSSQNCEK